MNDEIFDVFEESTETLAETEGISITSGETGIYFQSVVILLVGLLALSAIRSAFARMFWR